MIGLYPIVDVDALAASPFDELSFAEHVLRVRPRRLQLRAKHASARETLRLLEALRPLCDAQGTQLFANDRPDLAKIAGTHGIHVGQDDLPISAVRRFAPGLAVGISTHDLDQLESALQSRPDYVAFGPVFVTRSKQNPDPTLGLELLAEAARMARAANIPLVAIGGIGLRDAPAVAALGADVALISALVAPSLPEVEACARAFERALSTPS